MAETEQQFLVISYLNIRGQTVLPIEKQYQIEEFLKQRKVIFYIYKKPILMKIHLVNVIILNLILL